MLIEYPDRNLIVRTNQEAVAINDNPHGVLNSANLDYLLEGIRNKHNFHPEPVIAKAAFMLDYIANKGHIFIEGNKRTATAATITFLRLNGYRWIETEPADLVPYVLEVAQGTVSLNQIQKWLKERIKSAGSEI